MGHHGTNDPLLSLESGIANGKVKEGPTVVLAAASLGFSYAAVSLVFG